MNNIASGFSVFNNVRIKLASPYPLTGYKNTDASSTPDTLAVSADKSRRLPASG